MLSNHQNRHDVNSLRRADRYVQSYTQLLVTTTALARAKYEVIREILRVTSLLCSSTKYFIARTLHGAHRASEYNVILPNLKSN